MGDAQRRGRIVRRLPKPFGKAGRETRSLREVRAAGFLLLLPLVLLVLLLVLTEELVGPHREQDGVRAANARCVGR